MIIETVSGYLEIYDHLDHDNELLLMSEGDVYISIENIQKLISHLQKLIK